MSELDDAGTYYDLGPRKVTMKGEFHYMCTRNNNFSNRSQKGRIVCGDEIVMDQSIGWNGGNVAISDGLVLKPILLAFFFVCLLGFKCFGTF